MSIESPPGSRSFSSGSLVRGLQDGQGDAWERLIEIYAPLVRQWCRSLGLSERATPDVVQEVFLAVHRKVGQFTPQQGSGGFRGWLWTIARNQVRDHYRRLRRGAEAAGGSTALAMLHAIPDPELPDEAPSNVNDTALLLHRALAYVRAEFQEQTWTAFWRSVVSGHSTSDIAADLGVSPAAVRQARSRVLRRLRQQLGDA